MDLTAIRLKDESEVQVGIIRSGTERFEASIIIVPGQLYMEGSGSNDDSGVARDCL